MGTVQKVLAVSLAYRRAAAPAVFTLKEKRSEFIAALFPAHSAEEARQAFDSVRREHRQATHNCPAWRVGFPDTEEFSSDDGEPSGTAGRPILGELTRAELFDTAVVVTRYFGGVKLGVRGLIDAYAAAAAGVIGMARAETVEPFRRVILHSDYSRFNDLARALRSVASEERCRTEYLEDVRITVLISPEREDELRRLLDEYDVKNLQTIPAEWVPGVIVSQ